MVSCAYLSLTPAVTPVQIMVDGDLTCAHALRSQTADRHLTGFAAAELHAEVVMRPITQASGRRGPPCDTDIIGLAPE
jgi:hypothetical protein